MNANKQEQMPLSLIVGNTKGVQDTSVFKNIIGQPEVTRKLAFFVESHSEQTPIPSFLFTGSQGLGKSFMAQKIANSMGRELIEVNCGTIETSEDFIEGVLIGRVSGDTPKTILLDEAQQISPEIATDLLTLLNPNVANKNFLVYKNWSIEYDFSKINTIFATTDAHSIDRPLLNRCVEIYFRLYTNEELFKMLKYYLGNVKILCDPMDVAYACRGRARDAFLLSQHIKRYCNMKGSLVLNEDGWKEIKGIFGIYPYGLNGQEVGLMKILENNFPLSVNNMAIRMGISAQNIEGEIEMRPKELGFIESGTRGRFLSREGKEYLEKYVGKVSE